jgi:hypothetical protein
MTDRLGQALEGVQREGGQMGYRGATLKDVNFRQLVKACASDPEIVGFFNEAHGLDMKCPIRALVEPIFPLEMSDEEMLHVAWFVAWVQHNQWQRLKAVARNLAKLKKSHDVH